jgi:ATP-dependent helicase/nuclease subunit A
VVNRRNAVSNFTQDQRRAIDARGNVLVMAGAGTGKTRTLVERCVEWLLAEGTGHSIDQILVVTFTEAAAAEMRQRIRAELRERLARETGHSHLAEQIALLDTACISTLHSFCFRLVREHFYELELDPQVTILPAEEAQLLAEETLNDILERHYSGSTPEAKAVQGLIQVQARGWDLPIKQLVRRLHAYAQTLPDSSGWFAGQQELFSATQPERWQAWLHSSLRDWTGTWRAFLRQRSFESANVSRCLAALERLRLHSSIEEHHQALEEITAAFRSPWPRGSAGPIRDGLKDFFQEAEFLHGLTGRAPRRSAAAVPTPVANAVGPEWDSEDPLVQDWQWTREHLLTLLALTREFASEFTSTKRELGVIDFHDLEQLSLRLLWDGKRQAPTSLAETWRRKLELVFVDEYQDINAAQDAILRALSREGQEANRFLVGDPKQSIYRFRLANPHIFQAYAEQWGSHAAPGQLIALRDNFRSREGILRFVNAFFSSAMRQEMGGVAYDELAQLRPGQAPILTAPAPGFSKKALPAVEFLLRLTGSDSSRDPADEETAETGEGLWANLTNMEREARLVGLRLIELQAEGHPIWDPSIQGYRPVQWRDMVILLRSPQSKVEAYAKEFSHLHIPLLATRGGFFESLEIADLLNLLNLLDNPLQDMPLVAVLRSPFAGLTLDQLALIRLAAPGRFWVALQRFHRLLHGMSPSAIEASGVSSIQGNYPPAHPLRPLLERPNLRQAALCAWTKVDAFLARYRSWRQLARQNSLSACLDQILGETHYLTLLEARPRGAQLRGNVRKLLSWARQFDQFQRQSLFRFLKFVEAQRRAEIDREPALVDTDDAVRLMSIHQSKGLEFEVVVAADLGKPFNLADLKADIILDEEYGLCPLVKPPFTQQRYPSLPYWLARRRERRETLGEELRLLYVAMTRARHALILTGTASQSAAKRWSEHATDQLGLREMAAARGYLDWLGPWMAQASGRPDWAAQLDGENDLFRWKVYPDDDPRLQEPDLPDRAPRQELEACPVDAKQLAAVQERLAWHYPFQTATEQRAKASVSAVRLGMLASTSDEEEPVRRGPRLSLRTTGRLSAAEIGVAHHTFLQFAALEKQVSLAALASEADRLCQENILSPPERAALDLGAIEAFWQSPVGRIILEQRDFVHRELPFTAWMPLEPEPEPEFMIVTGVVDLAVILPEALWILDFKTDAVAAEQWEEKARSYEPQLELYARALKGVYGRPVAHCWLHSLALGQTKDFVQSF